MAKIGVIVAQHLPSDSEGEATQVAIVKELRNLRTMLVAVINEMNKDSGHLGAAEQNYK